MIVTDERLAELQYLLELYSKKTKLPSDGLGIYLGDGIPRSVSSIRSNELLSLVNEVLEMRNATKIGN